MQEIFTTFDADGSGEIDVGELGDGLRRLGVDLAPEELNEFIDDVDVDGGSERESEMICA